MPNMRYSLVYTYPYFIVYPYRTVSVMIHFNMGEEIRLHNYR
uniref:Uncharacterized protein n=1 Tax=Picea glauca TaxID=3330 RepID=A0A117NIE8_PICGL|nr:hypothetical protein ABT39_MTgene3090 [Picea glauca]